ncbi:hypothetical protein SAMN02910441_00115 [Ruminococcus sp. YE282]|nr:hypothetical protein SAMN02910441_00115 [Ruminococcus bromii]
MQLKLLGLEGAANINLVRNATVGMAESDLSATLAKTSLTAAEQAQILTESGLSASRATMIASANTMSASDLYAALTKTSLVEAITAESLAESGLTQQQIAAAIAASNLNATNLALIISTSGLNAEQQISILMNKGMSAAEAEAAVSTAAHSAANVAATATTSGLSAATGGLTAALNGLKVAFSSHPILLFATIAATAIAVIVSLVSKIKSASERLEESASEVKELQDKISGLNDDLNTTKKRIDELLRKDTLTIVEQAELSRLRKVNAELEKQIALEKKNLETAKGKNEKNFVDSVNEQFNQQNPLAGGGAYMSNEDYFRFMLGEYLNPTNEKTKDVAEQWLDEFVPKLNELREKIADYDYTTLSDDAKAAYDKIMDVQNAYLAATSDNFDLVFKDIFNSDRFAKGREELEKAAKDGLTAAEVENLYNSNDDVKAMVDNMKDVGLITDTTSESFKGLAAQIEQAEQVTGSIASDAKVAFSDLISNENVQEVVNGFKTRLTELSDALEGIKNGDLSESDLIDLFEKFPELANRTDDLDVALEELINSTQTEIDNQFESWAKNMPTSEDANSLNAVKESLDGIASKAIGIKVLSAEIEKLSNDLDDLQSVVSDIQDIQENFNDNGYYSTDDLQKLLELEPEYLNLLIDENGQINTNSQAYKNYIAAKAKSLLLDQVTSLYESILNMSVEEAQAYATAKAYDEESNSIESLTKHYYALAQAKDVANKTTAYTDAMKQSFNTVANYAAIYDSWLSSLNSSTNEFTSKTNGATSALESQKDALESQKSALQDYKDGLEDAKDALEDYKDSLEGAQDDIQSLIDLTIDYIKQTKENEKSALQDSIDSLEDKKSALDDQKDAYSKLISKRKEEIEALYEEKKAQDELSEKQKSAAKDALALAIAQLDDSSAGKKSQKQAADNYAESSKDLKDYLDEQEKDKRISALEEEETRYSEMIEQRKAAIDAQVEHLESKIDEIDAYLDNSRKLYEDACRMIDNDNGTLYSNLWNYTYTYTTKTRAEFDYLWSSAQAAIQRYKGDNDTLIGTMEFLQGKIYDTDRQINDLNTQIDNCETQIGYLDDAISSTSDAISATSDSIDSVSGSLDGLGNSISDYINKLNQLTGINVGGTDNSDTTPKYLGHGYDAASGNYYYKVKFRGRDYYGYVGDSSDTTSVRERAYNAIMKEVYKYNNFNDVNPLLFKNAIVNHHAKGTRHSAGGVSVTQEEGLEAIFGKLSQGQYTMMPQGSQVFNAGMTDNLWKFSSDPQKFISDVIGKMSSFLSSSYGNFADSARGVTNKVTKYGGDVTLSSAPVYHIYGNIDKNTLSTMDKQERQRYELFKKQFMLEMLREKNNL